ncbi:MAG: transglycosylase SLT domain-containing protein [Chloroflexi bacterium]|nr:transglycosylase SLT domain-containing protein [Chloroflexota bacterium]MDA1241102.1 transglycosylase SLT domain-containing protein [Chloroflexota bacterium]
MMRRRITRALGGLVLAFTAGGALLLADVRPVAGPADAPEIVVAPGGSPSAPLEQTFVPPGTSEATPPPTMAPARTVIRLPEHLRIFRAFAAIASGSEMQLRYHAAVIFRDSGDYEGAWNAFRSVAETGSTLAPIAALRAAQMIGLAGFADKAAEEFAAVIAQDALPASLRPAALMDGAAAMVAVDRPAQALEWLALVEVAPGVTLTNRAKARWERSVILREQGDPGWYDLAIATMEVAPTSPAARSALDALEDADITPPGMLAAFIEYRGFRSAAAEQRYRSLIVADLLDDTERATAWFYIGAVSERFGNRAGALEAYANSLAADAASDHADDARYWRGRVFEELELHADATVEYDRLLSEYPASDFAADAALRAGIMAGLLGQFDDALRRLGALAATGGSAGAEAARWHGLFREQAARTDVAPISAGAIHPLSYAAVLERGAEAAVSPFPASAYNERAEPFIESRAAVAEIHAWLTATFGAREHPAVAALDDPTVVLALDLARAGEPTVAGDLLLTVLNARRGQPFELLDIALATHDAGLHDISMIAASRVMTPLSAARRLEAPRPLLMLAFPAPYGERVHAAAEEFGVPPLLLLALVKQESAFNPRAGSHAGAFGLTQVIEPTGASIARALDEPWSLESLADPAKSLRFGAFYLAEQLQSFDGHMLAALSAYNGGPGNASRWLGIAPYPGADGYILGVDFVETRSYLELVTENYAMYRFVYAGAEARALPTLP